MTLRLLLIRHGLSSFNLEKRIQGRTDLSTLTAEGKEQALETGRALSQIEINAIYSSPLKRAYSTTKCLIKELDYAISPVLEDGLLEIDLGDWSGLKIEELRKKFPNEFNTWQKDPNHLEITKESGEKFKPIPNLIVQAKKFIKKILEKHSLDSNETILIIGHNAILRCIILALIGEPDQGFRRIKLDNCSISILNLNGKDKNIEQCQIECLNNTTHLKNRLPKRGDCSRIILVRHGETDWNMQGRFQGQIDIPLNKNGKAQANAAGSFLRKEIINKAYSSSLSRPLETANLILRKNTNSDIKVKQEKGLIEIGHGLWEGKLESEIAKSWPSLLKDWKEHPASVQMPEGETIKEVAVRSLKCWKNICQELKEDETALVVAHDAVNKTILCHLLGLSPADIWMIKQGNGAVTVIDISKDKAHPDVVTCLNLTSHLGGILDCTAQGAL